MAGPARIPEIVPSCPSDPLTGKVFDHHFRIITRLGEGGVAVAYQAEDMRTQEMVVLKMLGNDALEGPDAAAETARLYREANVLHLLQSPHTVRIRGAGKDGFGRPYIILKFVKSKTLRDEMGKDKHARKLPFDQALRLIEQICHSLEELHGKGFAHRDIKPDNILIDETGQVIVIDFGAAKPFDDPCSCIPLPIDRETELTAQGRVICTPAYAAPERFRIREMRPSIPATDVYALGVILFEMLTGRQPFEGSPVELIQQHLACSPPPLPPTIPPCIATIVTRMLNKSPEHRGTCFDLRMSCEQARILLKVSTPTPASRTIQPIHQTGMRTAEATDKTLKAELGDLVEASTTDAVAKQPTLAAPVPVEKIARHQTTRLLSVPDATPHETTERVPRQNTRTSFSKFALAAALGLGCALLGAMVGRLLHTCPLASPAVAAQAHANLR